MKTLTNSIKLCLLLLFLLPTAEVSATHVAGGTMTYRCLGNSTYEISMTFRRDCINGDDIAPFDDPATFGIYDGNGNLATTVGQVGRFQVPLTTNDTLIETLTTECNVISGDVCIQTTVYIDTLVLPTIPEGYIIAYQRCCRNMTLQNVMTPLETGATYWVRITEFALQECNSSPTWISSPPIFICAEDTLDYKHDAFDIDGDSLVYEICTPSQGLTRDDNIWFIPPNTIDIQPVALNPGFSEANLFGGGDPLTIDPNTGQMYAVPAPVISQFLVGVCVKEFRNGQLLSEVRRDYEINIRICGRSPVVEIEPDAFQKCNSLEIDFTNNTTSNFLAFEELDFTWFFDFPDTTLVSNEVNPLFTFPESGLYTVALIADDGACQDTAFVEIGVATEDDPALSFDLEAINCNPVTTVFLNANHSFTDSIPDDDYNWTITLANGDTVILSGRDIEYDIGDDQEIEIALDVTGPSGCTNNLTETMNIITEINPRIDFDLDSFNCNSITTIDLFSTVTSTETINDSDIVWTIMANGIESTVTGPNPTFDIEVDQNIDVSLTVTTPQGCVTTVNKTFDIMTEADPQASFDFSALNCQGTTVLFLNGTASSITQTIDPNTFNWIVTANGQDVTLTGANTSVDIGTDQVVDVTLNVSTLEGCTTTISNSIQVVTVPFEPIFNNVTVCPGETAVVYTNTAPNTTVTVTPSTNLFVDAGGNHLIINNVTTQTYTIEVDNGDCQRTGSVTVNVDSNPNFSNLQDVIQCGDETVSLNNGGNTAYVYNWEGPGNFDTTAPNPSVSLSSSGTYFVTISTSAISNCLAFDTMTVTRVEFPTIDFNPSNSIIYCEGTEVTIDATSDGMITWLNNGFAVETGPTFTISDLNQSTIYTVESVNSDGCLTTENLEVQFIPSPLVPQIPQTNVCFGDTATVEINVNEIAMWTNLNGDLIATGNEITFTELRQDTTLILTLTNDLGCINSGEVEFGVFDLPERTSNDLDFSVCKDLEFSFDLESTDDVEWFDSDGNLISSTSILNIPEGLAEPATYFAEYTNSNGCMNFDTLEVMVFEELGLAINEGDESTVYCQGFSPELNTTSEVDADVTWTVDGMQVGVGDTLTDFFPAGDFMIIATGVDDSGCIESDTLSVNESIVAGNITGPQELCLGDTINLVYNPLSASEFEIIWTPGDIGETVGTTYVTVPSESTIYTANYINDFGCIDTVEYAVTVGGYDSETVATTSKDEICLLESVDFDLIISGLNGNYNYEWTPASSLDNFQTQNPTATPPESTTYSVLVTDDIGCVTSASVEVRVIQPTCSEEDVFLPNMFTPNEDMMNDVFKPESNFIESMSLVVYDRWGEEVYSTTDLDGGWDGRFQGEELAPDVYGYYFTAVCVNGLEYQKQGNVTLIK